MTAQTVLLLLLVGLMAGILGGLIGVGGGIIVVPALVLILGYSQHEAQGTSLGLLLLPVGILAVLNYYKQGYIDVKVVLILSLGFVIGGWIGSKFSLSISDILLKKVFACIIVVIAVKMLFFDK
ncbi:MAG: TSUP family transporter [Chitinophagaceae bacterium]